MIKETASCVYLMIIHTPRLCNDVVFQPAASDRPNTITCQEIVETAAEEKEWQTRVAREAEEVVRMQDRKMQQNMHDPNGPPLPAPLVIGGILVGGRALAGATPETTIRASNIVLAASQRGAAANAAANANANANVGNNNNNNGNPIGPGEEQFVATLAKSDGKYTSSLDEAEMSRLGLKGTRAELENWNREMRELAGEGVPWRLDVVRTDKGLEFRGIVSDVEDDEETEDNREGAVGGGGEGKGGAAAPGAGAGAAKTDGVAAPGAGGNGDDVGSEEEYK